MAPKMYAVGRRRKQGSKVDKSLKSENVTIIPPKEVRFSLLPFVFRFLRVYPSSTLLDA